MAFALLVNKDLAKLPFALSLSKGRFPLIQALRPKKRTVLRQAQDERSFHMRFPCLAGRMKFVGPANIAISSANRKKPYSASSISAPGPFFSTDSIAFLAPALLL
jgi:hypothetical protein